MLTAVENDGERAKVVAVDMLGVVLVTLFAASDSGVETRGLELPLRSHIPRPTPLRAGLPLAWE